MGHGQIATVRQDNNYSSSMITHWVNNVHVLGNFKNLQELDFFKQCNMTLKTLFG